MSLTIPCAKCGRVFTDMQALRQHIRYSRRCEARRYRQERDAEILRRTKTMIDPAILIEELQATLANVKTIARTFASDGEINTSDRGMFALAALKTIYNLVMQTIPDA